MATLSSYNRISGPPTVTVDDFGIYTTTFTYTDGTNTSVTSSGFNPPDIRAAVQIAMIDLATNYNQTVLIATGVTADPSASPSE